MVQLTKVDIWGYFLHPWVKSDSTIFVNIKYKLKYKRITLKTTVNL